MTFVIQRLDQGGGYVSRVGSRHSYTTRLQYARVYPTREQADGARCPENERVLSVEDAMRLA